MVGDAADAAAASGERRRQGVPSAHRTHGAANALPRIEPAGMKPDYRKRGSLVDQSGADTRCKFGLSQSVTVAQR